MPRHHFAKLFELVLPDLQTRGTVVMHLDAPIAYALVHQLIAGASITSAGHPAIDQAEGVAKTVGDWLGTKSPRVQLTIDELWKHAHELRQQRLRTN